MNSLLNFVVILLFGIPLFIIALVLLAMVYFGAFFLALFKGLIVLLAVFVILVAIFVVAEIIYTKKNKLKRVAKIEFYVTEMENGDQKLTVCNLDIEPNNHNKSRFKGSLQKAICVAFENKNLVTMFTQKDVRQMSGWKEYLSKPNCWSFDRKICEAEIWEKCETDLSSNEFSKKSLTMHNIRVIKNPA